MAAFPHTRVNDAAVFISKHFEWFTYGRVQPIHVDREATACHRSLGLDPFAGGELTAGR